MVINQFFDNQFDNQIFLLITCVTQKNQEITYLVVIKKSNKWPTLVMTLHWRF